MQLGFKHKNIDSGTIVNYNHFKTVHPLFCFNVSKHESNIYWNGSTADIEIKLLSYEIPATLHNIYCVMFSERKEIMEVINSKLYVNI